MSKSTKKSAPAPKQPEILAAVKVKGTVPAPKVNRKVAKAALESVAKVAPAQVKGATAQPVVGVPKFADTARITLVTQNNPRKEVAGVGEGEYNTPHKRYAVIMQVAKSKNPTVEAFLKVLPKWRATLNRAAKEGHITIATLSAAVLVGGMIYNMPVV